MQINHRRSYHCLWRIHFPPHCSTDVWVWSFHSSCASPSTYPSSPAIAVVSWPLWLNICFLSGRPKPFSSDCVAPDLTFPKPTWPFLTPGLFGVLRLRLSAPQFGLTVSGYSENIKINWIYVRYVIITFRSIIAHYSVFLEQTWLWMSFSST